MAEENCTCDPPVDFIISLSRRKNHNLQNIHIGADHVNDSCCDEKSPLRKNSASFVTLALTPDKDRRRPSFVVEPPEKISPLLASQDIISSEDDHEKYLELLHQKLGEGMKSLSTELHEVVRKMFINKLHQLCRFLEVHGISLCDKDLLGKTSKETALCQAIVKGHTESIHVLIDHGGADLIMKPYTTKQYKGATALHLAILKQDDTSVQYMLDVMDNQNRKEEKLQMLHAVATGQYFVEHFKYICFPLSLAVGTGSMTIFDILLEHGADLWFADDITGNTSLHCFASVAKKLSDVVPKLVEKIVSSPLVQKWWERKEAELGEMAIYFGGPKHALLKVENNDGHTPFSYASCLGATEYAAAIFDVQNVYTFPQWEVGPRSLKLYEMSEIDTAIRPNSKRPAPNLPIQTNKTKNIRKAPALEIFAFVLQDEKVQYGNIPAIKQAILCKWEAYKYWFYSWGMLHLMVMILFTLCLENRNMYQKIRNTTREKSYQLNYSLSKDDRRMADVLLNVTKTTTDDVWEILDHAVDIYCLIFFLLEIGDVIRLFARGYWRAKGFLVDNFKLHWCLSLQIDIFRTLLFIFCSAVLAMFFLRMANTSWQDLAHAIAALSGWLFMLFFTRAFQNIGIFTVMLQRMLKTELLYFSVVFVLIMIGCSTATYALFKEAMGDIPEEVDTINHSFFSHFRLLFGLEGMEIAEQSRLPWMVNLTFFIFVLLANVLLLNMLIAAMNNTFTQLENTKELIWLRIRTQAILMVERRLPICFRPKGYLKKYGQDNMWFMNSEEVED